LARQLRDLPGMLERSGCDVADAAWLPGDTEALRAAVPGVVAAVEATWADVRAD
jgi:hypothetical protein